MRPGRRGHLVELSLDNLVAPTVVEKRKEILVAPGARGFGDYYVASSGIRLQYMEVTRDSPRYLPFRPIAPVKLRPATCSPHWKTIWPLNCACESRPDRTAPCV